MCRVRVTRARFALGRLGWGWLALCTSLPSSETHIGMGVPQKRLRETAQSRAFSSQLRKRFSLTKSGTQYVWSLLASSRSLSDSTLINVDGTAR
eukprot:6906075-Prymnesium_polylepis.1